MNFYPSINYCAILFIKKAKVCSESGDYTNYITFEGKCKEDNCGALLSGWCDDKPEEGEALKVSILTKNTIGQCTKHNSKRPLKGKKRKIIGQQLANDLACNWRRNNVEDMEFGRISRQNLYHKDVLRKAKQEFKN